MQAESKMKMPGEEELIKENLACCQTTDLLIIITSVGGKAHICYQEKRKTILVQSNDTLKRHADFLYTGFH